MQDPAPALITRFTTQLAEERKQIHLLEQAEEVLAQHSAHNLPKTNRERELVERAYTSVKQLIQISVGREINRKVILDALRECIKPPESE